MTIPPKIPPTKLRNARSMIYLVENYGNSEINPETLGLKAVGFFQCPTNRAPQNSQIFDILPAVQLITVNSTLGDKLYTDQAAH